MGAQAGGKAALLGLMRRDGLGAKPPRLLILDWCSGRRRVLLLLLPRVLPLALLKRAELAPLGAAQPPLRLQLLQTILLRSLRILRLQIIPLRVLPLAALERAQLAPLGAAQPSLRLQLLQTILLRSLRILRLQIIPLRVLPLAALEGAQLAPVSAA